MKSSKHLLHYFNIHSCCTRNWQVYYRFTARLRLQKHTSVTLIGVEEVDPVLRVSCFLPPGYLLVLYCINKIYSHKNTLSRLILPTGWQGCAQSGDNNVSSYIISGDPMRSHQSANP